ncbi:MAG: S1/P1 nuclease [Pseudomonadota bacterium]
MRVLAVVIAACITISPAFAWGKTGHRVTGAIAEEFLSEEAEAAINDLLGPGGGLAEASTWPDFMRSSPEKFWKIDAGVFHYVTVPAGQTYAETGPPPLGDAVTALAAFRETLRSETATRAEKQLALRFTIHIVGDLHNPMHAGNGTDRGGNDFLVVFFDEVSNLHKVWDEDIIDRELLSYSEWASWALPKISPELLDAWWTNDPQIWIAESVELRDVAYPASQNLSWDYVFAHRETIRTRLSQGGVRIAAYLNEVFATE